MNQSRTVQINIANQVASEREALAKLSSTDPLNKFLVGVNTARTQVVVLRKPETLLSPSDALLLAAWLVDAADNTHDLGAFKSMLLSVRQTQHSEQPSNEA